jgi:hypothetical protein
MRLRICTAKSAIHTKTPVETPPIARVVPVTPRSSATTVVMLAAMARIDRRQDGRCGDEEVGGGDATAADEAVGLEHSRLVIVCPSGEVGNEPGAGSRYAQRMRFIATTSETSPACIWTGRR